MITDEQIIQHFAQRELDEDLTHYLHYHLPRYKLTLHTLEALFARIREKDAKAELKLLDVGQSFLTELVRHYTDATVNTLGFEDLDGMDFAPRQGEKHYTFDLNTAIETNKCPDTEEHDVVVVAEVIEHLLVSPLNVFKCAASWLKPGGYLIVQTPNGASLRKRLMMAIGRVPFAMPPDKPVVFWHHLREYTIAELTSMASEAGLKLDSLVSGNFYNIGDTLTIKAYDLVCRFLPPGFRSGLSMTFKKVLKKPQLGE